MGLFQTIFGRRPASAPGHGQLAEFRLLNGYDNSFTAFSGNAWSDDKVRAAVDSFARRAAVVQPRHIRRNDGKEIPVSDNLNRILQFEPNPYSTAYKFYYRLAANYKIFNGAFIFPVWDQFTGGAESALQHKRLGRPLKGIRGRNVRAVQLYEW